MGKSLIIKGADFSEVAVETISFGNLSIAITPSGEVTISTGGDDDIYYTTDGSTPTTNSTQYSQPFNLALTPGQTIVKAMAILEDASVVYATKTYNLSANTFTWGKGGITKYGQTSGSTNSSMSTTGAIYASEDVFVVIDPSVTIGEGYYKIRAYYISSNGTIGRSASAGEYTELTVETAITQLTIPAGKYYQIALSTEQTGVDAVLSDGPTALLVASIE